jgi:hypothetical protein
LNGDHASTSGASSHPGCSAQPETLAPDAASPSGPSTDRRQRALPILLLVALSALMEPGLAAQRSTPDEEGQALAAELRTEQPTEALTTAGLLRVRDPNGKWGEAIPVRLEITPGTGYWQTRYLALTTNQVPFETLIVTRSDGAPTRYDHTRAGEPGRPTGAAVTLTGDAAAIPFAGSEFWLSDLGLEFLHWPQQRVLRHEMRKGRSCKVLESLNSSSSATNYARVLSWIDIEHRGILRAEAYDRDRRLLKEFSIGSFKKVDGRWQLKSMEIRNEKTDARTRLEFDLEVEDR